MSNTPAPKKNNIRTEDDLREDVKYRLRDKNLLLSAAAGSGKTYLLIHRIAEQITQDRWNINDMLVLTFTDAAANEMKARIGKELYRRLMDEEGKSSPDADLIEHLKEQIPLLESAHISTIHAFCQSLISQYYYLIGLDPQVRKMEDYEKNGLEQSVLTEILDRIYKDPAKKAIDLLSIFAYKSKDSSLRQTILDLFHFSQSLPFPEEWIQQLPEVYSPKHETLDDFIWMIPKLNSFKPTLKRISEKYKEIHKLIDGSILPGTKTYYDHIIAAINHDEKFFLSLKESTSIHEWYELIKTNWPLDSLPKFNKDFKKALGVKFNVDDIKAVVTCIEKIRIQKRLHKDTPAENYPINKLFEADIYPFFKIPESRYLEDLHAMYPAVNLISQILKEFSEKMEERKKQEGLMDFEDMQHYALEILIDPDSTSAAPQPSEIARTLQKQFKEVMIDEYQDTNGIQELITQLVSRNNNRFMVGDIKQSIYHFRGADHTIFKEKMESFRNNSLGNSKLVNLSRNFRSDPAILACTNFIFRQLMTKDALELDYGDAESLNHGRDESGKGPDYAGGTVSIEFIDRKDVSEQLKKAGTSSGSLSVIQSKLENIESLTLESRLIAERIKVLHTVNHIPYSDMAILMRAVSSNAPIILNELRTAGIPAVSDKEEDYSEAPEVQILVSLLQLIHDSRQAIPQAAILRSHLIGLDEADLAHLKFVKDKDRDSRKQAKGNGSTPLPENLITNPLFLNEEKRDRLVQENILSKEKADRLYNFSILFRKWQNMTGYSGAARLLRTILDDTGYFTYISGMPDGDARKSHILSLYNLALTSDQSSIGGLDSFLKHFEQLKDSGNSLQSEIPSGSNAVHLMTIHGSKGLQFKVVFLANAEKNFDLRDMGKPAIYHKDLGLGIQCYNQEHLARWSTLYWDFLSETVRKELLAEEARLLYVAMTRAKDKLYIISASKDFGKDMKSWCDKLQAPDQAGQIPPLSEADISAGKQGYIDWIMKAALHHKTMKNAWGYAQDSDQTPEDYFYNTDSIESLQDTAFEFKLTKEQELFTLPWEKKCWEEISRISVQSSVPPTKEHHSHRKLAEDYEAKVEDFQDKAKLDEVDRLISWKYGHPSSTHIPTKMSPTDVVNRAAAKKAVSTPHTGSSSGNGKETPFGSYNRNPSFMNAGKKPDTRADYGIHVHKAMEILDFKQFEKNTDIAKAIQDSKGFTDEEKKYLTESKEALESLKHFIGSPLKAIMDQAKEIRKEMDFSILLPANLIDPDWPADEEIFLEGAMDCVVFNPDGTITIIDYKTNQKESKENDNAFKKRLKEHYKPQLRTYAEAAEKLFPGQKVKNLYLWAFTINQEIEIPREDKP